jgi:hypothetical protein
MFLSSREINMDTARAAAAFMFMFNIIEGKRNRNEKCVGGARNCIVSECNVEIDLCEI